MALTFFSFAMSRQEFSDTVAFSVSGPTEGRRLFWCPDIDSWEEWDLDVRCEWDVSGLVDGLRCRMTLPFPSAWGLQYS